MLSTLRFSRALVARVLLSLTVWLVVGQPLAIASQAAPAASPPQGPAQFAQSDFQTLWTRTDAPVAGGQATRSWLWGPAPGTALTEPFADAPGGQRAVQYFDKARMEMNPEVTDPSSPWRVTTGLLVQEMVEGRVQVGTSSFTTTAPSLQSVAGDNVPGNPRYADFAQLTHLKPGDRTGADVVETIDAGKVSTGSAAGVRFSRFVPETGHNIPAVFWDYMNQTGSVESENGQITQGQILDWVYVMGYPITEPYWANVKVAGTNYLALVQLYQRRALTYVPQFPSGWQVQMANVGQHYFTWRYSTPRQPGAQPTATPVKTPSPLATVVPSNPAPDGYIGMSGSSFTYAGAKVKLKGSNYWLSDAPFSGTWGDWDGPRIMAEMSKARDLGVNVIRIGIPYDVKATNDVIWADKNMTSVSPTIRNDMNQLLQIASLYGMKVIFTLFEWYDQHPDPGSRQDMSNIAYLQGIVGDFADDDRIMAWDLHNEPDFYDEWQQGKQDQVIRWLERINGYVRNLDHHHLVTVGVGDYHSLWQQAGDGSTIMSFVDFVAFHCYDAGSLSRQISDLKAHTTKPLLLEEMGWPTSRGTEKPVPGTTYDETVQTFLYKSMLNDAKQFDIAGVVQWTLWDYAGGDTWMIPDHERYFGLVRADGSFKPAAQIFKDNYTARPLPSIKHTSVPLDTSDHPNVGP